MNLCKFSGFICANAQVAFVHMFKLHLFKCSQVAFVQILTLHLCKCSRSICVNIHIAFVQIITLHLCKCSHVAFVQMRLTLNILNDFLRFLFTPIVR